jgi:adenosylcobinamide kinase / adenosylcobinamide-phosphate guanylyltransferase
MARPPADLPRNFASALPPVTLVLGGARSGKSRFAESLITATPGLWVYLATGEAGDAEMAARIRHHREQRGEGWITIEETLDLSGALHRAAGEGRAILVDCLTLWVSNLMAAGRDVTAETERLIAALLQVAAPIIFVANEVGLGIVPDNALARAFRDEAGRVNQAVAAAATRVYFVAAGLPLVMKDETAVASVHRIERKNART